MSTVTRTNSFRTFFGRTLRPVGLVAIVAEFFAIRRERKDLQRLDTHILHDIGYSRAEAKAEAERPTWDAPSRWLR